MKKYITINTPNQNTKTQFDNIIKYLKMTLDNTNSIHCNFDIPNGRDDMLEKLKTLTDSKIIISKHKKHININANISHNHLEEFIKICVSNEFTSSLDFNDIKIIINDNDGDFILIDSKKYLAIKEKL